MHREISRRDMTTNEKKMEQRKKKTHDSENLTTKLWVGMSAACATSLSVMAIRGEHNII